METLRDEEVQLLYTIAKILPNRYNTLIEIIAAASPKARDLAVGDLYGLVEKGYLERKFLTVRLLDGEEEINNHTVASFRIKTGKKDEIEELAERYMREKEEITSSGGVYLEGPWIHFFDSNQTRA